MWHYHKDKGYNSAFEAHTLRELIEMVSEYNTRTGYNVYEGFDRITYLKKNGTERRLPEKIEEEIHDYLEAEAEESIEECGYEEDHTSYCRSLRYE